MVARETARTVHATDTHEPGEQSRRDARSEPKPRETECTNELSPGTSEPEPDAWDALPEPVRAELERLLAADDWPGLAELGATGALLPLGLEPAALASAEALGRALFRAPAGNPGLAPSS